MTDARTMAACDNSGTAVNLSSGATLLYNHNGECFLAPGGGLVELARITVRDLSSQPHLWFQPLSGTQAAVIDEVTKCPDTNTGSYGYTSDSATPGRFKLHFSIPSSAGAEWGWNFFSDNLPPPLKIKVRIKRPV